MEAILKFDLPDEEPEFLLAASGKTYHSVLWELRSKIISMRKYGDEKEQEEGELFEGILNETLNEQNISIDI